MATAFRALGQNPTKNQIAEMMKEADSDGKDTFFLYFILYSALCDY